MQDIIIQYANNNIQFVPPHIKTLAHENIIFESLINYI